MTLGSKEHCEMIKLFESAIGVISNPANFDKEPKELWKIGHVYKNGQVNQDFCVWSLGYSAGRSVYMEYL